MLKDDWILKNCKAICVQAGMRDQKADDIAHIALSKFHKSELTNSRAIQVWLNKEIKRYKSLQKKNARAPT